MAKSSIKANLLVLTISSLCVLLATEFVVRSFVLPAMQSRVRSDRPPYYYAPVGSPAPHDFGYNQERPADTFRMVVIGDSFTFPTAIHFDDAFPKRLERMFRLQTTETKAEVLNFGQMGVSTLSEMRNFERALTYNPNFILLEITLNDPQIKNFHSIVKKHPGKYTYGNLEISKEKTPLLYYWKTAGLIASRLHNASTFPSLLQYFEDSYADEHDWMIFESALNKMKNICAAKNIPFAAVVFPLFYTRIDDNYPFQKFHKKIHGSLEKFGITYLDLTDAFRDLEPTRLQIIVGEDSHPNEIAHRIAADNIYDWLKTKQLIPTQLGRAEQYVHRGLHPKKLESGDALDTHPAAESVEN